MNKSRKELRELAKDVFATVIVLAVVVGGVIPAVISVIHDLDYEASVIIGMFALAMGVLISLCAFAVVWVVWRVFR